MTGPSANQIAAALDALRTDAQAWLYAAEELTAAEQNVRRLLLDAFHFTSIGHQLGLTEAYWNLQEKLVELLGQGVANFESLAEALRNSAEVYQAEDEAGVHRMLNTW